jgi:hypothetical protein
MEMPKNSINWFEIPVADFNRAKTFYENILQFQMATTEMHGFQMGFFPVEQGLVGGAICQGDGYIPTDKGSVVYLNCFDDLSPVLGRVEKAGGKVVVPKMLITPEIGYCAFFLDTEGNRVALHSMH